MNKSESAELVTREDQGGVELSLHDLVAFIRRNLGILLGGALIGGVLGLAMAFIQPLQWEASTLIQVGQLGNAGGAEGGIGTNIEPPLRVADRIKNRSFQNDVLKNLGLMTGEDDSNANVFRDTLKVKLEKSELLNLTLRAMSPDEAKLHMSAVVNELKKIHTRISVPTISRWHQELASIDRELKQANTEAERLAKSLDRQSDLINDKNFSQVALLSNILIMREVELREFHDEKRMLEERLSPERTFDTNVLGRIEVSTKPVFPKKSLYILAGLVMGLLLGVLLSILRSVGSRNDALIKS
jgi:capsular polysaccharide biosynthesis protein